MTCVAHELATVMVHSRLFSPAHYSSFILTKTVAESMLHSMQLDFICSSAFLPTANLQTPLLLWHSHSWEWPKPVWNAARTEQNNDVISTDLEVCIYWWRFEPEQPGLTIITVWERLQSSMCRDHLIVNLQRTKWWLACKRIWDSTHRWLLCHPWSRSSKTSQAWGHVFQISFLTKVNACDARW